MINFISSYLFLLLQQKKDSNFHIQILDKIRKRITEQGSICLTVERNTHPNGVSKSGGSFYGNTVGTVEFSPSDFEGTAMESIGASRKVYVADLAIRPDARRMGLATKMLLGIEQYCHQHQYHEIYLHVEVGNFVARKLYQKLGYVELAHDDHVVAFTETRLQKAASGYILLRKSVINSLESDSHVHSDSGGAQQNALRSHPRVTTVSMTPPRSVSALASHPVAMVSNGCTNANKATDHTLDSSTGYTPQVPTSATWHAYQHTAQNTNSADTSSNAGADDKKGNGGAVEFPFSYSI